MCYNGLDMNQEAMAMRVLDIDLDFFLEDCCPLADIGQRPELAGHEPWPEEAVVAFLENQCGLSAEHPLPGRIFETHDQALLFWEEKIAEGRLTAPFHVTHVDAHSDLGIGHPGPGYVLYNVISMPMERRMNPAYFYEQHKLDEANYLLFALAMRRIASLDNIRNPRSHADIPGVILASEAGDRIQLCSLTSKMFEKQNGPEPVIPFAVYDDYTVFRADAPYDFVTLAISPRYAPQEADALADVIGRYIRRE